MPCSSDRLLDPGERAQWFGGFILPERDLLRDNGRTTTAGQCQGKSDPNWTLILVLLRYFPVLGVRQLASATGWPPGCSPHRGTPGVRRPRRGLCARRGSGRAPRGGGRRARDRAPPWRGRRSRRRCLSRWGSSTATITCCSGGWWLPRRPRSWFRRCVARPCTTVITAVFMPHRSKRSGRRCLPRPVRPRRPRRRFASGSTDWAGGRGSPR